MKHTINYALIFATITTMGISFHAVALPNPVINSTIKITQNTPPLKQRWENKGDKLMEKLNLSAEQQQQIESIRSKYQPEIDNVKEQMQSEREKMSAMMKNNESQDNLRSQHQEIVALQQKMNNLRFESLLETREVLTLEQRQQFSQMMSERSSNWRGKKKE